MQETGSFLVNKKLWQKVDTKVNVTFKHTHAHAHTDDNATGFFPLSVSLCGPMSSNMPYLLLTAWAKVNTAPSKTSHFPSHLLTTRGPKHTAKAPFPKLPYRPILLSFRLWPRRGEKKKAFASHTRCLITACPRARTCKKKSDFHQKPEACDDPKMSGTIAVFFNMSCVLPLTVTVPSSF